MAIPYAVSALTSTEPALSEYVAEYLQGTPLRILEIRIRGALGKEIASRFTEAFRSTSPNMATPNELEGSLGQMHGLLGDSSWAAPQLATCADDLARPGYDTCLAHEYLDVDEVLQSKVALVARLVHKARRCVVYAGAGLSTASGLADYATRTGQDCVTGREASQTGKQQSNFILPEKAMPNLGHFVLSAMTKAGLLWRLVQQNHDGLLQKAGVPQSYVNEIHGSWFDPGNPVVKMTECLRSDLYEDINAIEKEADLVLVLGSSLAGMSTDRIVSSCAKRALNTDLPDDRLGTAIVSLQCTPHDAESSVRVFSTLTSFLKLLAAELQLEIPEDCSSPVAIPDSRDPSWEHDVFSVPYDIKGNLLANGIGSNRTLDLREGAQLVVTIGPDKGQTATIVGKHAEGHYKVSIQRSIEHGAVTSIRYFGLWWVDGAVRGDVPFIPLVSW